MVCKARSGSNHFCKCPGYEATFLATLKQRAEIAISLRKQFYTFAQLLAVPLANPRISDSTTVKIKTAKISETWISACFMKITNHTASYETQQ